MRYLWVLFPAAVLWVIFYLSYQVMLPNPFDTWWSYPLLFTFVLFFIASAIFAIIKVMEDD